MWLGPSPPLPPMVALTVPPGLLTVLTVVPPVLIVEGAFHLSRGQARAQVRCLRVEELVQRLSDQLLPPLARSAESCPAP